MVHARASTFARSCKSHTLYTDIGRYPSSEGANCLTNRLTALYNEMLHGEPPFGSAANMLILHTKHAFPQGTTHVLQRHVILLQ